MAEIGHNSEGRGADLRQIAEAARPSIRAALDAAEELAAIRDAASAKGIDWSQLKSLLKAQEQDARDDGKRVSRIVEKADYASAYADMLGIRREDERKKETRSSSGESAIARASRNGKARLRESMKDSADVAQEAADAGLISQEAAAETRQIAQAVAQKLAPPDDGLDIPDYLDRRKRA